MSAPSDSWRSPALVALIAGGITFCIGELIWQLIGEGPFGWHVVQVRTWQGGIEVLALAGLLALAAMLRSPRWRLASIAILAELYLRRHFVDLPMLVDLVYLEILIGLGAGAARLCGIGRANDVMAYLRFAIAGIVLWSLGAWLLSAFGIGSLKQLRLYTLVLALPALAARQTPLCVFVWRRFATLPAPARAGVAVLGAWFLCLAARTNMVSGFDPWWYGLRGEYVLVAGGSVFKSLGLVAPVHYYPKLYELLLIPVSALHDISVIEGVSILMLGLFALTCMEALKQFSLGFGTRLVIAMLVATVPAIANAALSPKPDLFMAWVLLLASLEAMRFARTGSIGAAAWILALCALALASKLSAPPYVLALVTAAIGVWLWQGRPRGVDESHERRFAIAILTATAIVTILVTARTWILAGVPLVGPQELTDFFASIGLPLKPPVGRMMSGETADWAGVPELLVDDFFRPQRLAHMVIGWMGNVWLYLFVMALAARLAIGQTREPPARVPAVWAILVATGLVLLLTFRTVARGGDGNYFILPLALAILIAGHAAFSRMPKGLPTRVLGSALALMIVFQASYSFVSAGWAAGTRAFDLRFDHGVRDLRKDSERIFQYNGIATIAEYLRAVPGIPRGVGYVADSPALRLPATFETLNLYEYWLRAPLANPQAFIAYLGDHRLDYLVMPKPGKVNLKRRIVPQVAEAARELGTTPGVRVIDDRNYILYDLSALHAETDRTRR